MVGRAALERHVAFAIGDRQSAAGRDRLQFVAHDRSEACHRGAHARQVLEVAAGPDVHVESDDAQPEALRAFDRGVQFGMPDAVLARLATGLDLASMSVAEAWVHAQQHRAPRTRGRVLVDHEGRAEVDRHSRAHDGRERAAIEQVGRENDLARIESGRESTLDLAGRDGIEFHAEAFHQAQDGEVPVGLLCIAHDVETAQARDAVGDRAGVVNPHRRAVFARQADQQCVVERACHFKASIRPATRASTCASVCVARNAMRKYPPCPSG
jgi:hypothetical protein